MNVTTLIAVAFALTLFGCATSFDKGTDALKATDYLTAERYLAHAAREGPLPERGPAWNNLGVLYERTGRNNDVVVSAFVWAARYGEPKAAENLRRLGRPVPQPDLFAAVEADAREQAALRESFLELLDVALEGAAQIYANTPRRR